MVGDEGRDARRDGYKKNEQVADAERILDFGECYEGGGGEKGEEDEEEEGVRRERKVRRRK